MYCQLQTAGIFKKRFNLDRHVLHFMVKRPRDPNHISSNIYIYIYIYIYVCMYIYNMVVELYTNSNTTKTSVLWSHLRRCGCTEFIFTISYASYLHDSAHGEGLGWFLSKITFQVSLHVQTTICFVCLVIS